MPLQLLSRPTTDTVRTPSMSPFATPTSKPQIPTICLTTATPCNATDDASQVAPWIASEGTPVPIAAKPIKNGETSRRRLVPKKSKLRLLGSSSAKARERDFSDVVRRVQGASSDNGSNGFEIYVDPANDPDIGEILMVKKKKSRLGLDGMQWGMLGEVTNVPAVTKPREREGKKESLLKVKTDENQKWWSIGRGRKDSKEKARNKDRAKPPQPADEPSDTRGDFNSLDSGTILTDSINAEQPNPPVERSRIPTPPPGLQALPNAVGLGSGKDSVAIRAIRSVRSLARIGSWAQLMNTPNPEAAAATIAPVKNRESQGKKKKNKEAKAKEKDKAKDTTRYSGSSFEAGSLSVSPADSKQEPKSLGKKKASVLGLGLPSTIRLPSSRSGSTGSSVVGVNGVHRRLSGSGILGRGRSGSAMSTTSSLHPLSTKSCVSRVSSGSSGTVSVRWDEAGLETAKEIRRKDKESKSKEKEQSKMDKNKIDKKCKSARDSTRKPSDSRRRTPLAAIFPRTSSEQREEELPTTPIVMIEAATMDGCSERYEVETLSATPIRRVRPRPVSEQLLGSTRPKPIHDGEDDNVAMSLLDAATNDLAQLINRLDLEATPGSVEVTPMSQRSLFFIDPFAKSPPKRLIVDSPVKGLCLKNSCVPLLKPCTQSLSKSIGARLGQNIAPWDTLNASISPSKPSPSTIRVSFQDTVRTQKRTMTPRLAADPSPVFKALRPATTRLPISKTVVSASSGIAPFVINPIDRSPSALTFGSGRSKPESRGSCSPLPVFRKAEGHTQRKSLNRQAGLDSQSLPLLPDARRNLGLAGTMGDSIDSIAEHDCRGSDPDSDIPDELQVILSNSDQEGDDTISFDPKTASRSPGLPPELPLPVLDSPSARNYLHTIPVFRATVVDEDEHHADVEEAGTPLEDDTKKSFDFTGELQKLNESGAYDRRSFIEQLENAFRTPAKVDLRHDFGGLSPIPTLHTLQDELPRLREDSFNTPNDYECRKLSPSFFVDANVDPTLLAESDNFDSTTSDEELLSIMAPQILSNAASVVSRSSSGELNRDFKFGGKRSASSMADTSRLTLSDIIPPPEIAKSLSMASFTDDDNSYVNSILAHATEIKSPRERLRPKSDSGSSHEERRTVRSSYVIAGHRHNDSVLSFTGFDSFAEVQRGFEFNDNRPGFYPPPSNRQYRKHESIHSIASVSSYGNVLHSGSADPFDYASVVPLPSLRERPFSDDFSLTMPTPVDDTFSFLRRQQLRRRVDSDTSSFHFRTSHIHPYNRTHRRHESGVSIGPPISLFNRNSAYHRRGDSNTSISAIVNCGRFSWTRHRSNFSADSVLSDYSGANLSRPGLGDKMLDSALERGTPLASISASPPPSLAGSIHRERIQPEESESPTYDSIMNRQHETQTADSLFQKSNHRTSVCSSDSTFFEQDMDNAVSKPPRYRPISSLSIPSVHSPTKEDDTMISMLGGGHVRRRSVTSMIGASPCIQVERRKNTVLTNPPETVFSRIQKTHGEDHESPMKSRVVETKPSIASTANSSQFGDERMVRAKHGLLERQSLENTVLMGDGEDLLGSFRIPVFTRPDRVNRSRSSTCTSTSGADTPPLSDGYSSFSEGSLSSIDLPQLNTLLSAVTHPLSNTVFDRARPHVRGHRRRISQARVSRNSIYETIQEEFNLTLPLMNSSERTASETVKFTEAARKPQDPPPVYVVDPETSSVDSFSLWDNERGITALRRYYALRDEADDAITESKRTWLDTPFSVFALQSFDPPRHPSGMQEMLEHSLQNYGPLPFDLRPRRVRSRVNSRPSPYPRAFKTSFTSSPIAEHLQATVVASLTTSTDNVAPHQPLLLSNALQQISVDMNVPLMVSGSKGDIISPDKPDRVFGPPPRNCAASATRRWSKRCTSRNGVENKENNMTIGASIGTTMNVSQGTMMNLSDGLRLNRPRPRGRPTPATARPIRT